MAQKWKRSVARYAVAYAASLAARIAGFGAAATLLGWDADPPSFAGCFQCVFSLLVIAILVFPITLVGRMYNVSSAVGVQLYADHKLVTHGPFAIVRHPMYLGIILAAIGGLLIYRTWTLVFMLTFLGLVIRARREEHALAVEFGGEWDAYCRRVPGWMPRIGRR